MKLTTTLKAIKKESSNKLEKKVINLLLNNQSNDEDLKTYINDILQHGCQSGIVSELIYHSDTLEFYNKYKTEINSLLQETFSNYGSHNPLDIFGKSWDIEDPLCIDTQNQNLLSWFAMEEITRNLAYKLEIEC